MQNERRRIADCGTCVRICVSFIAVFPCAPRSCSHSIFLTHSQPLPRNAADRSWPCSTATNYHDADSCTAPRRTYARARASTDPRDAVYACSLLVSLPCGFYVCVAVCTSLSVSHKTPRRRSRTAALLTVGHTHAAVTRTTHRWHQLHARAPLTASLQCTLIYITVRVQPTAF